MSELASPGRRLRFGSSTRVRLSRLREGVLERCAKEHVFLDAGLIIQERSFLPVGPPTSANP